MFADLLRLRIFINSKYNIILWLVRLTIVTVGTQDVPLVSLTYMCHCPKYVHVYSKCVFVLNMSDYLYSVGYFNNLILFPRRELMCSQLILRRENKSLFIWRSTWTQYSAWSKCGVLSVSCDSTCSWHLITSQDTAILMIFLILTIKANEMHYFWTLFS